MTESRALPGWISQVILFVLSLATLLGFNTPQTYRNLKYVENAAPRQMVDIFFPESAKKIKEPVNVFLMIHGGGFQGGEKEAYDGVCIEMAKKGFVSATMGYRLYDKNTPHEEQELYLEDMLDDMDNAINTIIKKMDENGVKPNKLIIQGYSAGAILAMLYSCTRLETCPLEIAFIVDQSGPVALGGTYGLIEEHLNAENPLPGYLLTNSPIECVRSDMPPVIIFHGLNDDIVKVDDVRAYVAKLNEFNVPNDLFIFEKSDHDLDTKEDFKEYDKGFEKFMEYVKLYG